MGWSFHYATTRAQLIEYLLEPIAYTRDDGTEVAIDTLRHTCTGNNLWAVRERRITGEDPVRYVLLCLLQADRKNNGWGYKDMDESSGPYHFACPLSYLDLLTEPINDWSREWREKVRAYHAERAQIRALEPGAAIAIYGKPYTFLGRFSRDRFRVSEDTTGYIYSAKLGQITLPKEA
jgi:hypothetical protein